MVVYRSIIDKFTYIYLSDSFYDYLSYEIIQDLSQVLMEFNIWRHFCWWNVLL